MTIDEICCKFSMYNIERGALIMAKKNYTPEEMQAKMEKKASNCKVFFGTFTKALAVFLAIVVAWSLVTIAFVAPSMGGTVVAGTVNNGGSTNTDNSGSVDAPSTEDENLLGGDETTDVPAGDETTDVPADDDATTDAPAGDENADAPAGNTAATKADVIKLFNDVTAKAAKGSYKLTRTGKFIKPIDVGSATGALNKIIQGVDENASLDSVVGGFLGIKAQPITGEVKNGKGEGFDAKYMIKAMTLADADVKDFSVNGDKYSIQINACTNPGANSAIAHATNDYITFAEVNQSIANEVGNAVKVVEGESQANYNKILFTATIVDGKLTALDYSYTFGATLKLKLAVIGATGTGEASITGKYTNIKY